jgi:predicted dehydrogenase
MDIVRFGVIGVGSMGMAHASGISKIAEAQLIAGCDVVKENRDKFTAEHKAPCYETYQELIARDDIDAVCVVTPHPIHREPTVAALRAGKHVLVEKPMASHVKDADAMITAAKETGRKLGVVFQQRFNPVIREAARLIHSGELGDVLRTSMIARHLRTQNYYLYGSKWRGTWKGEGGGVLLNQAPHALDLFIWLGGMPVRLWGRIGTRLHDMETEDQAGALLEYPAGSQGTIQANTFEGPDSLEFQIMCTRGRIVFDRDGMRIIAPPKAVDDFIATEPGSWDTQKYETRKIDLPSTAPHRETIRDFALAIIEDRPPAVPPEEGVKSLELANAIVLSSEREKCAELPIDRDEYFELLEEKIRLHAK